MSNYTIEPIRTFATGSDGGPLSAGELRELGFSNAAECARVAGITGGDPSVCGASKHEAVAATDEGRLVRALAAEQDRSTRERELSEEEYAAHFEGSFGHAPPELSRAAPRDAGQLRSRGSAPSPSVRPAGRALAALSAEEEVAVSDAMLDTLGVAKEGRL
jgi:hypothetical protein